MSLKQKNDAVLRSGLMNLVEAATALTELVREVRVAKTDKLECFDVQAISDDDDLMGQSYLPSEAVNSDFACSSRSISTSVDSGREIFPQRLMQLLADTSISDIIRWLPHGKSFMILRPEVFTEKILPQYFPESRAGSSTKSKVSSSSSSTSYKYPSFTRKLNRWGFRQVTKGTDAGAFHHKFFKHSEPDLCIRMICQKSRRPKVDNTESQGHQTSISGPTKDRMVRVNGNARPETARQVTDSESVTSGSRASEDDSRKKRKMDHICSHNSQRLCIPVPAVISNSSNLLHKLPAVTGATTSEGYFISTTLNGCNAVSVAPTDEFKCPSPSNGELHDPQKILPYEFNSKSFDNGVILTSEQQLIMNSHVDLESNLNRPLVTSTTTASSSATRVADKCKCKRVDLITTEAHVRAEQAKAMLYQAYIQALSL